MKTAERISPGRPSLLIAGARLGLHGVGGRATGRLASPRRVATIGGMAFASRSSDTRAHPLDPDRAAPPIGAVATIRMETAAAR